MIKAGTSSSGGGGSRGGGNASSNPCTDGAALASPFPMQQPLNDNTGPFQGWDQSAYTCLEPKEQRLPIQPQLCQCSEARHVRQGFVQRP